MSSHPIDLSAGIVSGGTTPSIDLSAGVVHDHNPIDLSAGVVSEAPSPASTVAPQPSRWDRFKTTLENALDELHEGLANESAMMQAVGRGAPLANPVAVASPESPVRAAVGATQLTTPGKRVEGAANLLEGALGTAQPLLYAGAIEAPVPLAEGLIEGFAGQKAAESAAKAVGASTSVTRLAGDVGGIIAGAGSGRKAIEEIRGAADKPISDAAAHARYEQMPETAEGRLVSADLYKKALIDKPADTVEGRIEQNNVVHERSSDLARQRFLNALDRPQEGRPGVTIVAGAPGAGKSLALSGGIGEDQRAVYEGTFSNFDKTRDLLQAAIDSGHKPTFVLVHADPDVLADRIVDRAKTEGRLPPVSYVASKALEVPETARKLVEHFGDKVNWKLTDNSEPARPHAEYEGADAFKSQLDAVRYTGSKDELAERIRERYATGRQSVSADGASAGPGGAQEVAAGAVPTPVSGDAGNGDAGGAGGIAGPGRGRDPGTPQTAVKSPPAEIPPPRPYQYHPIDASQPLRGIFYHGTKAQVSSAHELNPEVYADPGGTAGIGLYLTDNPEVAAGYSRTRGRGGEGQVLPVQVNGAKLLDLEAPASDLLRATLKKDFGDQYEDLGPEATGQDLITRIHDNLASEGISKNDAIENFQDLAIDLKQQGIDGFLQKGGKRVGKQYGPHNVAVLFPDFGEGSPLSDLIADVKAAPAPAPAPAPAEGAPGETADVSAGAPQSAGASSFNASYALARAKLDDAAAHPLVSSPQAVQANLNQIGLAHYRQTPDFETWKQSVLADVGRTDPRMAAEIQPHLADTYQQVRHRAAMDQLAGNLDLERLNTPDQVKDVIRDAAATHAALFEQQRRGAIKLNDTQAVARRMVEDGLLTEQHVADVTSGTAWNAEQLNAARSILLNLGQQVRDAGEAYRQNPTDENLLAFRQALDRHTTVQNSVSGMTAEAGRALSSLRISAEAARSRTGMERALDELGKKGIEISAEAARRLADIPADDVVSLNKFLRDQHKWTTLQKLQSYWTTNLLSGTRTLERKGLGDFVSATVRPVTDTIRAAVDIPLSKIQGRRREYYLQEIVPEARAWMQGFREGIGKGLFTFQHGFNPDQAQQLGGLELGPIGTFRGGARNPLNWPTRAIEAFNEMMHTAAFQSEIKALAVRNALKEGLRGEKAMNRAAELVSDPTDEMVQAAQDEANYRTYTAAPGELGKRIVHLADWQPDWAGGARPLRFIAPFISVPSNILKLGIEHSPAGFLQLLNPADNFALARSAEASNIIAKAALGSALMAWSAELAAEGRITGAAPTQSAARAAFYGSGMQPFSIKIGDRWYNYSRTLGFLGIPLAGAAALWSKHLHEGSGPAPEAISQFFLGVGNLMLEQPFLEGMRNLVEAMHDPGRFGGNMVAALAQGLVPFSSLDHQIAVGLDPRVRNVKGFWDRIMAGLPVFDQRLALKYDPLGRVVIQRGYGGLKTLLPGPVASAQPLGPVDAELARLGVYPGPVGSEIFHGNQQIKLNAQQQSDYQREEGEMLRRVLGQVIGSNEYSAMTDEQRQALLKPLIQRVRRAQSLREHWKLQERALR